MRSTDVGLLVSYDGRVNTCRYVQLIGDALSAFINSRFGTSPGGFWYMQDYPRSHVLGYTKKFYERNKASLLEWLSTSPDRNPIENMWDMIDNQLRIMYPKSLMELKQMIERIWTKFTLATCKELADSILQQLERCVLVGAGIMSKLYRICFYFYYK